MKSELKIETDVLNKKMKSLEKNFNDSGKEICYEAMLKGAESAAKHTPPKNKGAWSRTINKDDYYRNVFHIVTLLKSKSYQQYKTLFRQKLNEGFNFVILKQIQKKKIKKMWFVKTLNEAKKYSKIQNRGIMKAMHGLALMNQGHKSPMFQKLTNKSPNLKKLTNLNTIEFQEQGKELILLNNNKTIDNPSLASFTLNKSLKPIFRVLKGKVKEWKLDHFSDGEIPF